MMDENSFKQKNLYTVRYTKKKNYYANSDY